METMVSIILINYNGIKFNKACIDSILLQTYQYFEIIFLDNASKDGSLEGVKKNYQNEIAHKKIVIVENKKNTGLSGGFNLGVKYANQNSEYICLLNNDTTVPINWLESLVEGIKSDPSLGAVGGLILDAGYEEQILHTVIEKKEVFINTLFGEFVTKKVSAKEAEKGIYYTSNPSGCSLLYKKSIVQTPFPEFYFAYSEDTFLFRNILKKGYKLGLCTGAKVYHFGSGSFGKTQSSFKLFYSNRNQIINFLVFYKTSTILKLLPLFLITQLAHLFINAFRKRLRAKIKSRRWIMGHIKTIQALKKQVKLDTSISEKEFMSYLSCKFSENLFFGNFSTTKIKIINKVNGFFERYCKYVLYK